MNDNVTDAAIEITFNEEPRKIARDTTLNRLLAEAGLQPGRRGVAVALNEEVVPKDVWAVTPVSAGDRILVITATQGG